MFSIIDAEPLTVLIENRKIRLFSLKISLKPMPYFNFK